MYARTEFKGLNPLARARMLLCSCETEIELSEALGDLYPCGPGGVGHAQREAKAYVLELINDIRRSEHGVHISFCR